MLHRMTLVRLQQESVDGLRKRKTRGVGGSEEESEDESEEGSEEESEESDY